jgi:two-component system alkaline phosphatase synthesis response regulator PhoP
MKNIIFAVEDDASLRELYAYALENDFDCVCFGCGESFFKALSKNKPDLIILDVMLPGEDGFAILSRIKASEKTARIPVLMVSARGEEIAKVKGLNMGADDYIAKPFGVLELIARIKANLRKRGMGTGDASYKDISVNTSKHEITAKGHVLQTTLKEYNLLMLLCKNAERVQEREAIFTEVWNDTYIGETRTLDIHIKELRKKLADAGSDAEIRTIRGVGYMLT